MRSGELSRNKGLPVLTSSITRGLLIVLLLYFITEELHNQVSWRLYGLIRQIIIRPDRATESSSKAAEADEFVDDASIIGIGRPLSPETQHRFYGPSTFWTALPIAFPVFQWLFNDNEYKIELKTEALERSRMLGHESGLADAHPELLRKTRAQNIMSSLSSLGVDTEEDFYVDIDQWVREMDLLHPNSVHEQSLRVIHNSADQPIVRQTIDGTAVLSQSEQMGDQTQHPAPAPAPAPIMEDSSTALEPGIRRASSLSQTPPTLQRAVTEDGDLAFAGEVDNLLAVSRTGRLTRRKKRFAGTEIYRVTRLTTHAADSFAWHSSGIMADILMLPLEALYWRVAALWFQQLSGGPHQRFTLSSLDSLQMPLRDWNLWRTVLLSFGIECALRGMLWRVFLSIVLQYERQFEWGRF